MKLKLTWLMTLMMAFAIQISYAQEKSVSGTITSATDGLPLPGVNVIVKGTTRGVISDFDGNYTISANTGETLVFSFVSMVNVERVIGSSNTISVAMTEDVSTLDEVVVLAYGDKVSKKKSTASVVQVSSEFIENRPTVNILNSLQGQAAGVNIASASGQPGTNKNDVFIRGVSSIGSSSEPLYVVDGVPLAQGFLRNFNQNEVASVTVLKDAAATAIYGNRGTNGVILITTKTGTFNESFAVGYSSSYGVTQFIEDNYNLGSARDQLKIQQKGFNEGLGVLASAFGVDGTYFDNTPNEITLDPNNLDAYAVDTDWQDVFFRQGITQSHDISMTIGGKKFTNFTNLGYFNQEGIAPTTGFQRFTLRNNFNGKSVNEKFNYGVKLFAAFSNRNQLEQETRGGIDNNVLQNPLTGYLTSSRFLPVGLYENGAQLLADFGNPSLTLIPYMLLDLYQRNSQSNRFQEFKTLLTFDASYNITDDLTIGMTTSGDFTDDNRNFAIGPDAYLSVVRASGAGQAFHGLESITNNRVFTFNHINKLTYSKTLADKHNVQVSLFTEYLKANFRQNFQQQIGLNPLTWAPGAGTGYITYNPATQPVSYRPTVTANKIDAGLFSYFALADYDYNSRFGLSASIRRDASYRFIEDNRWGTFWSVSGRWNIDQENFLADSDVISGLKLRASYGTTGNQNVVGRNVDSAVSEIFLGSQLTRDLNVSSTGVNNSASFSVSSIGNPDLVWETTGQFNVGIDFGLFNNRFTGAVDYYNRLTTDLYQAVPVSFATGISNINANDGGLRNSGYEFQGRLAVLREGDFKFNVFANFSYNEDKFTALGAADSDGDGSLRIGSNVIRNVGGQITEYFLVPYAGVNPANGNLLFEDINGNLTEAPTDEDRRATGKSLFPKIQGGFGFEAQYNGFFLNTLLVYSVDQWRFDTNYEFAMDARNAADFPMSNDLFDAWTPDNRLTDVPALAATNIDSQGLSDRFLSDASFLRVRNITLGYSLPSKFLDNVFIDQLTVRASAENYFTFTKWRGLDPERIVGAEGTGFFPNPKIVTIGFDVKF